MTTTAGPQTKATTLDRQELLLLFAWVVALGASLAVLFAGEVMGQAPCNLCWFQRAAMFPLAVILGVASFRGDFSIWRYGLPVAVAGLLVAAFHTALYYGVLPASLEPCGSGPSCTSAGMLLAGLPLPLLALAAFALIAVSLLGLVRSK